MINNNSDLQMYKNLVGLNKVTPKIKCSKAESMSLNSANFNLHETKSEANLVFETDLDQEFDDFGYPSSYNSINKPADDTTDSLNEEQEEVYDEFGDMSEFNNVIDNKAKQDIRLDLINEIKDEILDDPNSVNVATAANPKTVDEDEEELDTQEEIDAIDVSLNNLRICIDDIEELTDKSNKTCFVFVIQVNLFFFDYLRCF